MINAQPSVDTAAEGPGGGKLVVVPHHGEQATAGLEPGTAGGSQEGVQANQADEGGRRVVGDDEEEGDIAALLRSSHETDRLVLVSTSLFLLVDAQSPVMLKLSLVRNW